MGKLVGEVRQIAFHSFGDISNRGEASYLSHWALKITALVNDLAVDLAAAQAALAAQITAAASGFGYDAFIGDGVTTDFKLSAKVLPGSTPIVMTPQGQLITTSFTVVSIGPGRDEIHFNWIPRVGQPILVYYQPSGPGVASSVKYMVFESFTGDALTTDFTLASKVLVSTSPIVLAPSGQNPASSFTVVSVSATQDKIHFTWTPRTATPIMVWYQPSTAVQIAAGPLLSREVFTGDAVTTDFVLAHKILVGTKPLVMTPTAQVPGTSFSAVPYSASQDKLHFTWVPRAAQPILVYYQPV